MVLFSFRDTALKAKLEELKVIQYELNDAIKKKAEYADKVCSQADALKKMEEDLGLSQTRWGQTWQHPGCQATLYVSS